MPQLAPDPEAAEQIRDSRADIGSFALETIRAAALRPLALAPYDDLRGLCLDLEVTSIPDEHVLLAALAGFLFREECHYEALTCVTAQHSPHIRPDLRGLFVRLSAFHRYLRGLAGLTEEETARADEDDHQADRFVFTLSNLRDVCTEHGQITRAEACERWPDLAPIIQHPNFTDLTVDLGGDEILIEPCFDAEESEPSEESEAESHP